MPNYYIGRPRDAENPQPKFDADAPAGELHNGDQKIWVEGSLVISYADVAARAKWEDLGRIVDYLNRDRVTADGTPMTGGALYPCHQRVSRDSFGNYPRQRPDRRQTVTRLTRLDFEQLLATYPGRTLSELAVDMFPDGQGDPRKREPTLRTQLWHLVNSGRARFEIDATGRRREKRYYSTMVSPTTESARDRLLTGIVRSATGATAAEVTAAVRCLIELMDHNAGALPGNWRDPRGKLPAEEVNDGGTDEPF